MARILYLDDEDALVFLVTRVLGELGHDAQGYSTAPEALAAFRADPTAFDLVLTDFAMPGMNGLEFAAQILALRPDVLVALASGFVAPADLETAQRMGVRVAVKPATVEDATRVVGELLAQPAHPAGR